MTLIWRFPTYKNLFRLLGPFAFAVLFAVAFFGVDDFVVAAVVSAVAVVVNVECGEFAALTASADFI